MVAILMMPAKLATLGLLKIKVIWNIGFHFIISVYDTNNKILSNGSNFIADVFMWPKVSNSSVSMREAIITSVLQGFDQNDQFFLEELLIDIQ